MAAKKQSASFEESLARLDEIVKHLEKGDMPLSESLNLYEEGTALINACSKMLDEAEQKVVKLKKDFGQPLHIDFFSVILMGDPIILAV